MTTMPRDRLRELLDAVLDEDNGSLADMAGDAFASPFHFGRLVTRGSGESPMAMRRRVMLERAAWQLRQGLPVTEAAWSAGYTSVEGFSRAYARAFGHPPSCPASRHWLPAPNGIHFHPPMSLWVQTKEREMNPLVSQLVAHDLDDTETLLGLAEALTDEVLRAPRRCGGVVTAWDGPEESIRDVLGHISRAARQRRRTTSRQSDAPAVSAGSRQAPTVSPTTVSASPPSSAFLSGTWW